MSDYPNPVQTLQPLSPDADPLDLLFREIAATGNQVKVTTAMLNRADRLPPGELSVLQLLGRTGRQTVPQIARYRMTSRQNIQVTINRLMAQGWVEGISNPAHKRSVLFQLTPNGRDLLSEAEHRAVSLRTALADKMGAPSIRRATDFLAQLREALRTFGKEAGPTGAKELAPARKRLRPVRKDPAEERKAPATLDDHGLVIPPPVPETEIPLSLL
jgi:DNA-binding MarR family transcriptional regulator